MPKKLLLADDSVTIQRVIELTFAEEDIQVIAVGDGQQAIARIDAERPDVVLADIGMPERDGYEVAAHVKGNPQTAQIPVLLLTGAFEPIDEARARAVGCDGVLVKPFEPQMVINRVKDLLAGRRPASLWSMPPGPSGTVLPGHGGATLKPESAEGARAKAGGSAPKPDAAAATGQGASGEPRSLESLDDYFDRLDAAFSSDAPPPGSVLEPPAAVPPPAAAETAQDYGTWDIPTEPIRSIAPPPSAPTRTPVEAHPPEPPVQRQPAAANEIPAAAPELSPVAQPPALADAFAALLAAEQKIGTPSPAGQSPEPPAAALDDARIEEIVQRVLARMSEDVVRSTVLDVAERLVRDEIDKIKRQAKI